MNPSAVPWVELSVLVPLAGAGVVSWMADPLRASRWCLAFSGTALGCALLAALYAGRAPTAPTGLALDELSAPLLPLIALLHFLTALATARTKMTRFSFAWLLVSDSLRLASFGCIDPWPLVALLILNAVPPYLELLRRGRPTRCYALHLGLFAALLVLGCAAADGRVPIPREYAAALLFVAVLIRSGTVPFHAWVPDLAENASFGTALLFLTPITGVYAAVRLVLPLAPDWVLFGIGVASLVTALYAAGLAVVQTDARRFFAFLFLSHASLVLVGLELHTAVSLTGALALWASVALSLGGLGLTIRALEARVGRLPLTGFRGLYDHSPSLAVCFLVTGLASVGFPGMLGFVATEMVVDGAVTANPVVGVVVVVTAALNGIAILRAYFLLFTGGRHVSAVSLGITPRERFAVLTLAALLIGGGLAPQWLVASRHAAAEALLKVREGRQDDGPTGGSHARAAE